MSATINISNTIAVFEEGVWSCSDKSTERLLNASLPLNSPSIPNFDAYASQFAVDNFGAELLRFDEDELDQTFIY